MPERDAYDFVSGTKPSAVNLDTLPKGVIGYAVNTTSTSDITLGDGPVPVTGVTVSPLLLSDRFVIIDVSAQISIAAGVVGATAVAGLIYKNGSLLKRVFRTHMINPYDENDAVMYAGRHWDLPSAGVVTYDLRVQVVQVNGDSSPSGHATVVGGGSQAASIIVDDRGSAFE